jgi:hypothetical protein
MSRQSGLRASDADREKIAQRLHGAMIEGRISPEELDERLGAVFSARTYGELSAVVRDLPRLGASRSRTASLLRTLSPLQAMIALAVTLPVLLLLLAMVIFLVTGLLAGYAVWMLAMWWLVGRRGRVCTGGHRGQRLHSGCPRRLDRSSHGPGARAGFWA